MLVICFAMNQLGISSTYAGVVTDPYGLYLRFLTPCVLFYMRLLANTTYFIFGLSCLDEMFDKKMHIVMSNSQMNLPIINVASD